MPKRYRTGFSFWQIRGIYEEGSPSEIFDSPQKEKTIAFIKKLKFFDTHITSKDFDLMELQGKIRTFAEKYGLGNKKAYRLQLCAEELLYELISKTDKVDIKLNIEYSESEKCIIFTCESIGAEYRIFDQEEDALGVTIIKNTAKSYKHRYENGKNIIYIEMI